MNLSFYGFANLSLGYVSRRRIGCSQMAFLFPETILVPIISILKGLLCPYCYYKIGNLS